MTLTLIPSKTSESSSVAQFPAVMGAQAGCENAIQGNYHCLITEVDDHLEVHDLGSRGGTFVNGVRVNHASLRGGDRLSLNGSEFVVDGRPKSKRYLYGVRS